MRIVRIGAIGAAFIAGVCILSTSTSAAPLGPGAKMSGADPVYGSTGGAGRMTCSGHAAICTSRSGGSPKCASARASCMKTGVFSAPNGQVFSGAMRQ
jgi:hypothetical protein